jgi:hypothetical protein
LLPSDHRPVSGVFIVQVRNFQENSKIKVKKLISEPYEVDINEEAESTIEDEDLYREISGELSFRILSKAVALHDYVPENSTELPLKKVNLNYFRISLTL